MLPLEETEEEKQLLESMPQGREYQYPPIDLFRQTEEPDEQGVQEEMREKRRHLGQDSGQLRRKDPDSGYQPGSRRHPVRACSPRPASRSARSPACPTTSP